MYCRLGIFGGHSRTISNYWANYSLLPENFVLINKRDAKAYGLKDGDVVRLVSAVSNGIIDLGNGASGQMEIDGRRVVVDPRRGGGLCPNLVMELDRSASKTGLSDPISGSASFFDTRVKLEKV